MTKERVQTVHISPELNHKLKLAVINGAAPTVKALVNQILNETVEKWLSTANH